jgi:hypothetical protein
MNKPAYIPENTAFLIMPAGALKVSISQDIDGSKRKIYLPKEEKGFHNAS